MRMEKRDTDIYDIGDKVVFTPATTEDSYPATVIGYWYSFSDGSCWVEYIEKDGFSYRERARSYELKKINSIGYGSSGLPTI